MTSFPSCCFFLAPLLCGLPCFLFYAVVYWIAHLCDNARFVLSDEPNPCNDLLELQEAAPARFLVLDCALCMVCARVVFCHEQQPPDRKNSRLATHVVIHRVAVRSVVCKAPLVCVRACARVVRTCTQYFRRQQILFSHHRALLHSTCNAAMLPCCHVVVSLRTQRAPSLTKAGHH